MRGFETCWAYLVYAFNFLTLSPIERFNSGGLTQSPLLANPTLPKLEAYPIFEPPNAPEHAHFQCEYPELSDYEFCSAHDARRCWLKPKDPNSGKPTFDIDTNYEELFPKGITRKYVLDVTNETLYPDGCRNNETKLFNASYPGPWIEACWGDDIEVTVRNHLPCNGTTIHWHGLRQFESVEYDGVNAVTQCPIAPGDSYTYKFHARQYGTSWYHSHYSLQYGDGLAGPLTIHGPSSGNYTTSKDPILMTDWNQRSAFQDWAWSISAPGRRPNMTSILLNGKGIAPDNLDTCLDRQNSTTRHTLSFEKGVRYLLRLINTSVDTTFVFSIDGHRMEVVEIDFVPIKPYTTESVLIGIGQRYHVIVEALPHDDERTDDENYWIRTVPATGCSSFHFPYTVNSSTTGIVRYNSSSTALPTSQNLTFPIDCSDEPYEKLEPILRWDVPQTQFSEDVNVEFVLANNTPYYPQLPGISRWSMFKAPLWLNFSDPTILNPQGSDQPFEAQLFVDTISSENEQWIEILVDGPSSSAFAAHPIHLHGHDFALLAQGNTPFDPSTAVIKRDNPPRRDVALLPRNGYLLIAFKVDNPGAWLMHCHIAWHASSGLAMQILENTDEIVFHEKDKLLKTCENWNTWFNGERLANPTCLAWDQEHGFQDDSGI